MISVASRKAKGRRLQQITCKAISKLLKIKWGKDELIASREMGQSGTDVRLVGKALKRFPWSVEAKNQESWAVHGWIKQAKENKIEGTEWLLIAKRNRHSAVVILEAKVFFKLLRCIKGKIKGLRGG